MNVLILSLIPILAGSVNWAACDDLASPLRISNLLLTLVVTNVSVNGVSISVDGNITINNGKVFVNGKELEQPENKEEQKWKVPKGIKINKITTDMTIISEYDIEIDGNGKLEKKISLL